MSTGLRDKLDKLILLLRLLGAIRVWSRSITMLEML